MRRQQWAFRGLEVDHKLKLRWLLDRNLTRLRSTQNLVNVLSG
jgi:hypothetical protein